MAACRQAPSSKLREAYLDFSINKETCGMKLNISSSWPKIQHCLAGLGKSISRANWQVFEVDMFECYCRMWWLLIGVLIAVWLLSWYTRLSDCSKTRFREAFRTLADEEYGNHRSKLHALWRLTDTCALQDFITRAYFSRDSGIKLGAGCGCMFINPQALNHLLLCIVAHAALPGGLQHHRISWLLGFVSWHLEDLCKVSCCSASCLPIAKCADPC